MMLVLMSLLRDLNLYFFTLLPSPLSSLDRPQPIFHNTELKNYV